MIPDGFVPLDQDPSGCCDVIIDDSVVRKWAQRDLAAVSPGRHATAHVTVAPPLPPRIDGAGRPIDLASGGLSTGGAERMLVELALALQSIGYMPRVHIARPIGRDNVLARRLAAAGIGITVGGGYVQRAPVIWWGQALRCALPLGGIYVVHSCSALAAAVLRLHAEWIAPCEVVSVSGPAAAMAEEVLGRRVGVLWNGTSSNARMPKPSREDYVVGFLGRHTPGKNLLGLILALAALPPEVRVRTYGPGTDRRMIVLQAAQMLHLADRVDVGGAVRSPRAVWPQFDALACCSAFEGLPMVVIEAMRAGCPVLYSAVGDLPFILQDGVRGIAAGTAPEDIAAAVMRLRAMSFGARELIEAALDFAHTHLTAQVMAYRYAALLEAL
jgi:glycosyltransferase involved in cell wall biosynthesis